MKTKPSSSHFLAYLSGFILSIILTLAAFYLVVAEALSGWAIISILGVLAIGQLLIQVLFFLHLGREERPRWSSNAFLFMVMVVVILVGGSMWIMYNLNYHHGDPPEDINTYIMDEENIYK